MKWNIHDNLLIWVKNVSTIQFVMGKLFLLQILGLRNTKWLDYNDEELKLQAVKEALGSSPKCLSVQKPQIGPKKPYISGPNWFPVLVVSTRDTKFSRVSSSPSHWPRGHMIHILILIGHDCKQRSLPILESGLGHNLGSFLTWKPLGLCSLITPATI